MVPLKLNLNERMVLYGLVRYPEASGIELSGIIEIKRPTITKIRNKIFENGILKSSYIPNFQALGMEMLVFWRVRLNASITSKIKDGRNMRRPYNIMAIRTEMEGMGMATFPDFTNYRMHFDEDISELLKAGVLRGFYDYHSYFHPFGTNQVDAYFDYAPFMKVLLCLDVDEEREVVKYPGRSEPNLSGKEKLILTAIVANPELPDSRLAELIGVSRPTTSAQRNSFIRRHLIRRCNLPHMELIGAELVGIYNFKFDPGSTEGQRQKVAAEVLGTLRPFIQLHGRIDCTGVFLAKNFEEFKCNNDEYLLRLVDEGKVSEDVQMMVLPTQHKGQISEPGAIIALCHWTSR